MQTIMRSFVFIFFLVTFMIQPAWSIYYEHDPDDPAEHAPAKEGEKAVIPLAPEPIIKQDGAAKNDCERNAAKRFFEKLRQDHPRLPLIIIEDALSANAPHISELKRHNLRFILGVKPGDHKYLFSHVAQAQTEGRTTEYELEQDGIVHRFRFLNDGSCYE